MKRNNDLSRTCSGRQNSGNTEGRRGVEKSGSMVDVSSPSAQEVKIPVVAPDILRRQNVY